MLKEEEVMHAEMKVDLSQALQERMEEIITESYRKIIKSKESEVINECEWMTQTEASKWARVSPTTLLKWRREGLKVATIDGKTLVSKSEINRFLKSREF